MPSEKQTKEDLVGNLTRENQELRVALQKAHWKKRNQKNEIKRLNRVIIERNYLAQNWYAEAMNIRNGTIKEILKATK